VTMALGAKVLARKKAIVSRLESIEELAGMDVLCSDKTGTLTQNKLTLGNVVPWLSAEPSAVLLAGALASCRQDADPIDVAVLDGLRDPHALAGYAQLDFTPFDPVTKRTTATVQAPDGAKFQVAKGAPQVVFDLAKLGATEHMEAEEIVDRLAETGYRTLAVARDDGAGKWELLGILPLSDPPRPDSKETIARAETLGVAVKMVTGDNVAIAQQIAGDLGLGTHIVPASEFFHGDVSHGDLPVETAERVAKADGFAEVFPEHKYAIVKALQSIGHITGMTGDGVNDAPALKQANIGIAVSGATDAARAAAAVVLTAPGLAVIIDGIEEARRIFARMMSYTLYRIAITIDVMVFIVLATIAYGAFPLTPIMILALALLDDVPIMTIAFDNAPVSRHPVRWEMHRVLRISALLGTLAVVESFGMMYIGDTRFGLSAPQLQTMMFLQLVAGGHFMLFITRSHDYFWSSPAPAAKLFWAIVGTQVLAVCMAGFGLFMAPLSWGLIGLVYLYDFAWMVVQDLIKVAQLRGLDRRAKHATGFLEKETRVLVPHGALYGHPHYAGAAGVEGRSP
jgi:H+-transporting ATPase